MILAEVLFAVGNATLLIASYPLIRVAWANRTKLTGFSFRGSSMTFAAVIFIATGYVSLDSWINVALVFPTILFWGIIAWYTKRRKL